MNLVLHSDFIIIHQTYCPATIYLFKFNTGNTRIIKSQECRWRRSGSLFFNFKQISYIVLVFPLLTFNMQMPAGQYFNSTKFPAKHRRYTFVYHSYIFVYIRSYIFVHKVYSIPWQVRGIFLWIFWNFRSAILKRASETAAFILSSFKNYSCNQNDNGLFKGPRRKNICWSLLQHC